QRYWYTIASRPKEYHCTWQYLRGDTWLVSQTVSHVQAIRNSGGYFLAHTKTVEWKRKLRMLLIIVSYRCVFTVKDNVPSLDLQFKSTGKSAYNALFIQHSDNRYRFYIWESVTFVT